LDQAFYKVDFLPHLGKNTHSKMQYPVVAEIWSLFEASLLTQAKRLVEDISKREGKDPKELWALVRPQVHVGLLDIDIQEPKTCTHFLNSREGAVRLRCRTPCVLGFDTCINHANIPIEPEDPSLKSVKRIKDSEGNTYYLDSNIARDVNGTPKGVVEKGVLYLFTVDC